MSEGCLEGVWEVSEGCLSDSGYCLGGYDVQAIDNNPIRFIYITVFLFFQLPRIGQNMPYFGVSVGCLEGVWEVSGSCLSDFRYCLGGMVWNHLIKIQFGSLYSATSFSPGGHF